MLGSMGSTPLLRCPIARTYLHYAVPSVPMHARKKPSQALVSKGNHPPHKVGLAPVYLRSCQGALSATVSASDSCHCVNRKAGQHRRRALL